MENILNSLENGEEPFMLKVLDGRATEEEINEWLDNLGIDINEKEEIIDNLRQSYLNGIDMAKKISPPSNHPVSNPIIEELVLMKEDLKQLENRIDKLIERLNS